VSLSANDFSSEDYSHSSNTPTIYKEPPKLLFVVGLLSVTIGTLLGGYEFFRVNTASTNEQTLSGGIGYLLTVVIPIVFLQLIRKKHDLALKANKKGEPYDIGAGENMERNFLKVVALGFVSAFLSITVFFWPIAEKFA